MVRYEPLVAIVAGEASGDQHGAYLIREVNKLAPKVRFCGIAGPNMRAAGVTEVLFDSSQLAVMGLVEVIAHFKTIYSALEKMRCFLQERRPDLLILVDYPEFNLRLAKTAKALGIKVLYYISPQVWAWRQYRVHKIGRLVDMMAVILPFEVSFYEKAGVPVRFVGHPLQHRVKSKFSRDEALTNFGVNPHCKSLGLLPGSRRSEIKRLLPVLLDTAEKIYLQEPEIQYLLPIAPMLTEADIAPFLVGRKLPLKVISGCSYDVMAACDVMIAASGTVTLEAALMEVPLVVVYKLKFLSYWVGRLLVKVNHIALCNIIANESIAPELIQQDASSEQIAREALSLLWDKKQAQRVRQKFKMIRDKLGTGAEMTIAELTIAMLT